MAIDQERLTYLLKAHLNDTCTPIELKEFWQAVADAQDEEMFKAELETLWTASKEKQEVPPQGWDNLLQQIQTKAATAQSVQHAPVRRIVRWAAAAAILLLLATAGSFLFNKPSNPIAKNTEPAKATNDKEPGSNKAILTLDNGTQVILNSAANGNLAQQGNIKIVKLDSGLVAYKIGADLAGSPSGTSPGPGGFNTITTPRGGQHQVILADGSKVWLNAASSLRFPTVFSGNERKVTLTGEGYFEVAKNAKKPFKVMVNGMQVKVLGTHFNVNAYEDENGITTSLLEGAVELSAGAASSILSPGQQAILAPNASFSIHKANMNEVVAWKDGDFYFVSADMKTILRQFARWYDIDVVFEGPVSNEKFFSIMSRNTPLSTVLKSLKASGVKFRIEANKLIVQSI